MHKQQQTAGSVFLPAILCTALWGSAIPLIKSGYTLLAIAPDDAMAKLFFAGIRFAAAGAVVLLLAALRRASIFPARRVWGGILLLSAVQTVMQYVFLYLGAGHTTGVRATVLSATSTFFAVFAAHLFFKDDRMNLQKAVGCGLGFAGVLVILAGSGFGSGAVTLTGEGFMLFSAVGQGLGAVISRKISPGQNPLVITGWQLTLGGGVMLFFGLHGGGAAGMQMTGEGLGLLLYLVLVSAVAFSVWTQLLSRHAVGKVTIYMFLIPVFGALLSAVVLQEGVFTVRNFAALALVCAGIAAVSSAKK